ncbi:hypothetical protein LWI28_004471 [Acer negundo]|uniref:Uncharacterized protein n=1 Tax=Acer negundo TaxID=4023 RepID=A0AAD5IID5_ACENE|nr:hypothetical protein LWI28_004471 [Acer negundo]
MLAIFQAVVKHDYDYSGHYMVVRRRAHDEGTRFVFVSGAPRQLRMNVHSGTVASATQAHVVLLPGSACPNNIIYEQCLLR